MRDQHDSQTADAFPAKRGRPVLNPDAGPLTPAERAKRYRELRRLRVGRIAHHAAEALDPDQARDDEGIDVWLETVLALTDDVLLDAIKQQARHLAAFPLFSRAPKKLQANMRALVAELVRRYPA